MVVGNIEKQCTKAMQVSAIRATTIVEYALSPSDAMLDSLSHCCPWSIFMYTMPKLQLATVLFTHLLTPSKCRHHTPLRLAACAQPDRL